MPQSNSACEDSSPASVGRPAFFPSLVLGLGLALHTALGQAAVFELPEDGSNVVGSDTTITARHSDTLLDIARQHSLGYEEIIRANPGVDLWIPGEGTQVFLPGRRILPPGPREGIVVNIPEHRLYYYPKPRRAERPVVITYPISTGKFDKETPLGSTRVIAKAKNPVWRPTASILKEHADRGEPLPRIVPPGPDNPLGNFAMRLGMGNGTYLIHGTNNPIAVGMAVTHGCVRMYPEDIEALFPLVPVGTKVSLINEPIKLGDANGEFWLEAHPAIRLDANQPAPSLDTVSEMLIRLAASHEVTAIHWDFAREALQSSTGVTTMIGLEILSHSAAEDPAIAGEDTSAP